MLDEAKIKSWLDEVQNALVEAEITHMDAIFPTLRLQGAQSALRKFETCLEEGLFNTDPTPIKDIEVKPQNIVRTNDPSTSWEVAIAQTSEKRQELYTKIMSGLRSMGPATDEMLSDFIRTAWPHFKYSPSGLRTRRAELVQAGWVTADGKKKIRTGNFATVWTPIN